jgi:hypothetical protein
VTLTVERETALPTAAREPTRTSLLVVAAVASFGAGAIHAGAASVHSEHRAAVLVFTALCLAQLAWGAIAMSRRDQYVALAGATLSAAAVGGWVLAKTIGLPISGLDVVEPVQFADATAAALAALSGILALLCCAARIPRLRAVPLWLSVGALVATGGVGTFATASHVHAHGAAHVHTTVHPYDPALPIDLSGTPGVTPQQQAAAEQLVVLTIARLPQWADQKVAFAHGFTSIGDGFTGIEHLINKAYMTDNTVLNPDRPESLVYDTKNGKHTLVAAMYMVAPGTPLSAVPDVGGALVQWHIHDNLCYSPEGQVRGVTDATGACPAGLVKPVPTPMVHVWITPHRCGPFAALEGIAGGSIAAGQTRLCDHVHGAV